MSLRTLVKKIIPERFHYSALHLKKTFSRFGFRTETYSGDGEDIILAKTLFPKKRDGFYVDVGAYHPKQISNTYLLHQRGWRGINIDPNPNTIKLYKKYRPLDTNLQLGIAREKSTLTYHQFSHAGVNTFDAAHAAKKGGKEWNAPIGTSEIQCLPLSIIFEEHVPEGQNIDVLDIDVEGMDLEVLQSNDWGKVRPLVVLIEDRDFRAKLTESAIYKFLARHNYRFHCYQNITLIMVAKEFDTKR